MLPSVLVVMRAMGSSGEGDGHIHLRTGQICPHCGHRVHDPRNHLRRGGLCLVEPMAPIALAHPWSYQAAA